jgi:hypothetical protein
MGSSGKSPTGSSLGFQGLSSLAGLPDELQAAIANTTGTEANQQDWAQNTYLDNLNTTNDVTDQFLNSSGMGQDLGAEETQRYEDQFQPLEDQLINDANSYASPERRDFFMGQAQSQAASAMEAQRTNAQRDLESFGIDPSATRYAGLDYATRAQEGAAQAAAGTQAGLQTDALARAMRSEALNIGQRYPGDISAALNTGYQGLTGAENATLAQTASGANTMGTPQTWQALTNQATLGEGQLINQANSNAVNAAKTNQSASSGLGGLIGAGAGLVSSFFDDGGPVTPAGAGTPGISGGAYAGGSGATRGVWDRGTRFQPDPYAPTQARPQNAPSSNPMQHDQLRQLLANLYARRANPSQQTAITPLPTNPQPMPAPATPAPTWSPGATAPSGYRWGQMGQASRPMLQRSGSPIALADGGGVPGQTPGGSVPVQGSPSAGAASDDVPAMLTADEFVIPKDVATFKGHEFLQNFVNKARETKAKTMPQPRHAPVPARPAAMVSRPQRHMPQPPRGVLPHVPLPRPGGAIPFK